MTTIRKLLAYGTPCSLDCRRPFPSITAAVGITGLLLAPFPPTAFAQTGANTPARMTFEVASIKPSKNTAGPNTNEFAPGGQRFAATTSGPFPPAHSQADS